MGSRRLLAVAMVLAGSALPAYGIEMFTNFNEGMELGTRPLQLEQDPQPSGVIPFQPVRYHAYPRRWRFNAERCAERDAAREAAEQPVVSATAATPRSERPAVSSRRYQAGAVAIPQRAAAVAKPLPLPQHTSADEDQYIRSSNFLPASRE